MSTSIDERVSGLPTDLEEGNSGEMRQKAPCYSQTAIPKDSSENADRVQLHCSVCGQGFDLSLLLQRHFEEHHAPITFEPRLKAEEAPPQYLWVASPYVLPHQVSAYPLALQQLGTSYFTTEKDALNKARQYRIDHIDRLQKEINTLDERFDALEDEEMKKGNHVS